MLDLLQISGNVHRHNELHQNFVDEITVLTEHSLIINKKSSYSIIEKDIICEQANKIFERKFNSSYMNLI